MATHRLRSGRVALSAAFLGLAATSTGACAALPFSGDDEDVAYCTDINEIIVPDNECDDDDDGSHYVRYGKYPRGLKPGSKVPAGGSYFKANDLAARSRLSLGSTFSNGSTVKSGTVGTSGGGDTTNTSSGS
jgi:hypothetical protein